MEEEQNHNTTCIQLDVDSGCWHWPQSRPQSASVSCAWSPHWDCWCAATPPSCQLHHLDPDPTVNTLSLFITLMSHHIKPRSVHTYLAGIVCELKPCYSSVHQNQLVLSSCGSHPQRLHAAFLPSCAAKVTTYSRWFQTFLCNPIKPN